jgi:hypothetical protein
MEIKDILSELIAVSTNVYNGRGNPDNFDLEDFISVLENYYRELDDVGEFHFIDDAEAFDSDYYEGDY